jgi:hypothetical protein
MDRMNSSTARTTLIALSLFPGLPWARSGSVVPRETEPKNAKHAKSAVPEAVPPPAPDRLVLLAADDAEYLAYAIPRSYKTAPDAPTHLLVFRGGLCIRDIGLVEAINKSDAGHQTPGTAVVQQSGSTSRAFVAPDARTGVIVKTDYVSRVDVTKGQSSTRNDTVTGSTTVTLVDPGHPEGVWRVTLEDSRWTKDVLVLSNAGGVVLTTFRPRTGPTDVRVLDATGRESARVPESSAESLRIEADPEGSHVAAEFKFRANEQLPERGVMVFDLARGTQWTYSWRYGNDAEPLSWALESHGVLVVKLANGTHRFDATGRKL